MNQSTILKRRWPRIFLAGGLGLTFIWVLLTFGGCHQIKIDKETTYVTSHVLKDGRIDYCSYLNEKYLAAVDGNDNAAILLLPELDVDEAWLALVAMQLNCELTPVSEEERMQSLDSAIERSQLEFEDRLKTPLSKDEKSALELVLSDLRFIERMPWSEVQFPLMKQWLDENADALDRIVAATNRPSYFVPFVTVEENSLLYRTHLPLTQQINQWAENLRVRSMFYLAAGRIEDCQSDLLATRRLGLLLDQAPGMINTAVAAKVLDDVVDSEVAMIMSGRLSQEQLNSYLKALAKMPNGLKVSSEDVEFERCMSLGLTLLVAIKGRHVLDFSDVELGLEQLENGAFSNLATIHPHRVNWNLALKLMNQHFDKVDAAVRINHYDDRMNAFWDIYVDQKNAEMAGESIWSLGWAYLLGRNAKGKLIGRFFSAQLCSDLGEISYQLDFKRIRQQLLRAQLAIAIYHFENDGVYPTDTSDLFSLIPQAELTDPFTGTPFVYVDDFFKDWELKKIQRNVPALVSVGKNKKYDPDTRLLEVYNESDDILIIDYSLTRNR